MESNAAELGNSLGSSGSRAFEILSELEAQGVKTEVLKFYRWLYLRGLLEPPARIQGQLVDIFDTVTTPNRA